jgi:hypothetical protein
METEANAIVTMDGFSAASMIATCKTLSHRALSSALELDELVQRLPRSNPVSKDLCDLSATLQQLRKNADQLHHRLCQSPIMSAKLQILLTRSLNEFDEVTAIMDKQVKRLEPDLTHDLSAKAFSSYQDLLDAVSELFNLFIRLLSM